MEVSNFKLIFYPVNLAKDRQTCITFREDSYIASFGDARNFHQEDGKGSERYLDWLKGKLDRDPNSVVHVWLDDKIIGQMEMGTFPEQPKTGYVNLYYLIPEVRGCGFGTQLDNHSIKYFKGLGFTSARLSVSPSNGRAIRFYQKMNWIDLGPSPKFPDLNFMEKIF